MMTVRAEVICVLSLLALTCGALLGWRGTKDGKQTEFVTSLMRFDALHYEDIVEKGYSYAPERRSDVAFFPAYPSVVRSVAWGLGISSVAALLIVSNSCLVGAMFLLARYLRVRRAAIEGDSPIFGMFDRVRG